MGSSLGGLDTKKGAICFIAMNVRKIKDCGRPYTNRLALVNFAGTLQIVMIYL